MTIEERVAALKSTTDHTEAVKTIGLFLAELEKGTLRAATRDPNGIWKAETWVKEGIRRSRSLGAIPARSRAARMSLRCLSPQRTRKATVLLEARRSRCPRAVPKQK